MNNNEAGSQKHPFGKDRRLYDVITFGRFVYFESKIDGDCTLEMILYKYGLNNETKQNKTNEKQEKVKTTTTRHAIRPGRPASGPFAARAAKWWAEWAFCSFAVK